ncbi:hypothetical protein [Pseudoflavitalea rhizosphaerae]|uniref:hypothetical protein n=1 Tax=Pseudoflavitalea rhizosphaerae TaxID=1884793 RepID=UPI000F8F074F|nr:hypothetical protein [Pseudoflavitalea rhizosphaerae]
MARKPTTFDPVALEFLKEFVKRKVNLPCTSFSHIQQLTESIRLTTGEFLSLQTLNRLFGIIPNGFNPSLNTLDTLARYAGFGAFSDIEAIADNKSYIGKENNDLYKILNSLFGNTEVSAVEEPGIFLVIENLYSLIQKDLVFSKLIFAQMARIPLGRKYFFEQLVYVDQLAGSYGDALPVCLLYANDREQTFFILTMFCYKYFLMDDSLLFNNYFQILINYPHSEVMKFRPHIIDRYYAVLVLNEVYGNRNPGPDAAETLNSIPELDYFSSPPGYHHHTRFLLGEALLLAGQFGKAYEILNNTSLKIDYKGKMDKMYYETSIAVYKLVSGYFSHQINSQRAKSICHQLLDAPMPLLAADFLNLMLMCLLMQLEIKSTAKKICRDKIEVLVNKTKFTSFYTFLSLCGEECNTKKINGY